MGFAKNLCELMKSQGVSSYKMANEVKVHVSTVTNWKNGGSPKVEHIPLIAKVLGVTVDELLKEE